jgi:hypothetical protein
MVDCGVPHVLQETQMPMIILVPLAVILWALMAIVLALTIGVVRIFLGK